MPFYVPLKYNSNRDFAPRAVDRLIDLRAGLDQEIPAKTATDTLLLATWNIRDFDSNKFGQGPRLPESFYYIAEIIASFDLVAIQEVNEDLSPLKKVVKILGRDNWDFIVTDVTEKDLGGNGERLAYIYDKRKILFRNISGEIVLGYRDQIKGRKSTIELPENHKIEFTEDSELTLPNGQKISFNKGEKINLEVGKHKIDLPEGQEIYQQRQFARTPFLVSFQSGWFKFNLCTVHLYYGSSSGVGKDRRIREIEKLSAFLKKRSMKDGENYIMLGDFNIVSPTDDTFKPLKKHGFTVPQGVYKSNLKGNMYYDQIAFRVQKDHLQLGDSNPNSGVFDFSKYVFKDDELDVYHDLMENTNVRDFHDKGRKKGQPRTWDEKAVYYRNNWRTWQMSDHLLLWVELKVDFSNQYLDRLKNRLAH